MLAVFLGAMLTAQGRTATDDARQAQRLVRSLELPERTLAAARELSALGAVAVPPLLASLRDPRADAVIPCLWASMGLDCDVAPLREPIAALMQNEHAGVARAAMRALVALDGKGRTTLTDYHRSLAYDIGDKGTEELLAAWPQVMSAERLPSGRVLVCAYTDDRVIEFDQRGIASWTFTDVRRPTDAERLPNGNTLIADTGHLRVIEVTPAGDIVWKFDADIRPIDADRLPNGNTLIASFQASGAIEVDPQGAIVWRYACTNVRDADLLLDGTFLLTLTDQHRIVAVTRDGSLRREWQLDFAPNDAELLPEGAVLVAGDGQVVEIGDDGRVLARRSIGYGGRVARQGRRRGPLEPEPPEATPDKR